MINIFIDWTRYCSNWHLFEQIINQNRSEQCIKCMVLFWRCKPLHCCDIITITKLNPEVRAHHNIMHASRRLKW